MKRPLLWVCLCLVLMTALHYFWGEAKSPPWEQVASLEGQEILLTGRVEKKEEESVLLSHIKIQNSDFHSMDHQKMQKLSTISNAESSLQNIFQQKKLICVIPQKEAKKQKLRCGEIICVKAVFRGYPQATNPGEFDQRSYYYSMDVLGQLESVKVLWKGEKYFFLQEALTQQKRRFERCLQEVFPPKEAGILCTLLLGEKSKLDAQVKRLYQKNGMIHILSISGLHITLIGMGLYHLLRKIGGSINGAAILGGSLLLMYGIMVGMPLSACRAIGMYMLRMLSFLCRRTYDMLTALGVLATFMILLHPAYLTHAGFLLSFFSLIGVGVVSPLLSEGFSGNIFLTQNRILRLLQVPLEKGKEAMLVGISIFLSTLPIQLWFYYEVPVWSVFLNMLILPFAGLLVGCGFVIMLLPGMGFLKFVDVYLLRLFEWLCKVFDHLPWHTWNPGKPHLWQVYLYYVLLAGIMFLPKFLRKLGRKKETVFFKKNILGTPKRLSGWLQGFAIVGVVWICTTQLSGETKITFLDVGQGDGICLSLKTGENYLFDCGSVSRKKVGEYVLLPFLKQEGISHLDGIFLSHGDEDHIGGVVELLRMAPQEQIRIDCLVLPVRTPEEMLLQEFSEIFEAVEEYRKWRQLEVRLIKSGDYWEEKGNEFLCLNPSGRVSTIEKNADSECFYLRLCTGRSGEEKISMLLAADVEGEGEKAVFEQLVKRGISKISVLKVAHHGSRFTNSEELLQLISPRISVISVGRKNSYGHPHVQTLERLKKQGSLIYQTSLNGAITMIIRGEKITMQAFLP